VCPNEKCQAETRIETDVPFTKRPKCFKCNRLMQEKEVNAEDNPNESLAENRNNPYENAHKPRKTLRRKIALQMQRAGETTRRKRKKKINGDV
jgi:hypothetical protein